MKSQTLGGPPIRPPDGVSSAVIIVFPPTCSLGTLLTFQWQGCLLCIVLPQMQALPNRHAPQGHPGPRTPIHTPSVPQSLNSIVPYSVPAVTSNAQHHLSSTGPRPAPMQHQILPPAPQFYRHDSPYSSLPTSGLVCSGLCA